MNWTTRQYDFYWAKECHAANVQLEITLPIDIGVQTPLGEQLLHVAIREREAQIPTDGQKNHLRFKLAMRLRSGWSGAAGKRNAYARGHR